MSQSTPYATSPGAIVRAPTAQELRDAVGCGPLDLAFLNGVLKIALERQDNNITGASYNANNNSLTFAMSDGNPVTIDFNPVLNDFLNSVSSSGTVPAGLIAMWRQGASNIPNGWVMCDGQNGTPDLRDKFILGAGGDSQPNSEGGSSTHSHGGATGNHTITLENIPPHRHQVFINREGTGGTPTASTSVYEASNSGGDTEYSLDFAPIEPTVGRTSITGGNAGGAVPHNHDIAEDSNIPPFYALIFIMKV